MARKLKVKAVQIWLGNRLKEPHKKKKKKQDEDEENGAQDALSAR